MSGSRDLKKTALGISASIVGRFLNAVIGFLISIILVRGLTQEDYGAFKLISAFLHVATVCSSLGLESVLLRYVPELSEKKRWGAINELIYSGLILRVLVASLLIFSVAFYARNWIFEFLDLPVVLYKDFALISLYTFLVLINTYLGRGVCQAYLQQYYINGMELLSALIRLLFFPVAIYYGKGIPGLVLVLVAAEVLILTFYTASFISKMVKNSGKKREKPSEPLRAEYRRILRFGAFRSFSQFNSMFKNVTVDLFVLSKYRSVAEVGLYGFVSLFAGYFTRFSPANMMTSVVSPIVTKRYTSSEKPMEVLNYSFGLLNTINMLVLIPVFAGMVLLLDKIIVYVYNPDYLITVPAILILCSCYFIRAFVYPCDFVMRILERTAVNLIVSSLSIYNLIMDLLLIPSMGVTGAAIATGSTGLLSYLIFLFMMKYAVRNDVVFPWRRLGAILANVAPMILFLIVARSRIDSLWALLAACAIAAAIYLVTCILHKIFSDEDRKLLSRALGRKVTLF